MLDAMFDGFLRIWGSKWEKFSLNGGRAGGSGKGFCQFLARTRHLENSEHAMHPAKAGGGGFYGASAPAASKKQAVYSG